MRVGIIYIATDTTNNMQYVGQTTQTLNRRKRNGYNQYFQRVINKRGNKIEWEIIGEFPIEQLDLLERRYISKLSTIYPMGYNFDSGGNKNKTLSEETKRKLSEVNKGKRHSEATKKKMSKAQKGKKHTEEAKKKMSEAGKGRKHTDETKRKLSEASKGNQNTLGKKLSEEHKRKLSKAHKGKKLSEEHKRKLSKASKGEKHPLYGKHHTEEAKKKMSEARKGKYCGENGPNSKLTVQDVLNIRKRYINTKITYKSLAEIYDVEKSTIMHIIKRTSWRHI